MDTGPRGGDLFFEVDARHIRQLGRQLVGDRVTALVELVKNAYDADATRVRLDFTLPDDADESTFGDLVISDDGAGMSFETIQNGWMKIASDDKERNPTSPGFGRTRAGRKGLGRFAAESLGMQLTLWSKTHGAKNAIEVTFRWRDDYEPGNELGTVPNAYRIVDADPEVHGTRLVISGLNASWPTGQRERVARALLLLQPPFPIDSDSTDPGFVVEMVVNGRLERAGSLDEFRQGETAHVTGSVNAAGELRLHLRSQTFDIDRSEVLEGQYLLVGEFLVDAGYYIYSRDALGVPVRVAQTLANEFGGIRIYRDGLRILPYGERNDDWLGLDETYRRRSVLQPIGNQNWFAQVLIGRDTNPLLEDTSSREGLLNNEAYEELVEATRELLLTASRWVAEVRQRRDQERGKTKLTRANRQQVITAAAQSVEEGLRRSLPAPQVDAAIQIVRSVLIGTELKATADDTDERREIETLQGELELLRVLSSLGTSISVFSHEVRSVLTTAARSLLALEKSGSLNETDQKLVARAGRAVLHLSDIAKYVDSFTGGVRGRARAPIPLSNAIKQFVDRFAAPMSRSVEIEVDVLPIALRTAPMSQSALEAILINLYTNAAKAMDRESHGSKRVKIQAFVHPDPRKIIISFQDTGVGIGESVRDRMFDAFVTTAAAHSSDADLGVGTGLGLKVVRDLVHEYGGSVSIGDPDEGFSTSIEIVLPRWKEQVP